MSCTINLQSSVNWCLPQLRFQPVDIGSLEPVLSSGNMILQTMLGPPFCWPFNRNELQFPILGNGTQDYQYSVGDFAFIEKAWLSYQTTDGDQDAKELTVRDSLGVEMSPGRPQFIAKQRDNQASGVITFRLAPAPSFGGMLTVLYQMKAMLMSSLASFWYPIPDELSYTFNYGLLSILALLVNDPRVTLYGAKFASHLLGAQDGITELQRNIFLTGWMEMLKYPERAQQRVAQAIQGRQVG